MSKQNRQIDTSQQWENKYPRIYQTTTYSDNFSILLTPTSNAIVGSPGSYTFTVGCCVSSDYTINPTYRYTLAEVEQMLGKGWLKKVKEFAKQNGII